MFKTRIILGATVAVGALAVVGNLNAANQSQSANARRPVSIAEEGFAYGASTGPDVTVVFVGENGNGGGGSDIAAYGQSGGIYAYSAATTSCNIGNQVVTWSQNTNNHPVIGQNLYRLKNGRFEQVGMSWLKHSFCAVSEPGCKDPNDPFNMGDDTALNCSGTPCSTLGIGCADTYWGTLNGDWDRLGPRYQVNASTGFFNWPHAFASGNTTIRGRLQVKAADIEVTSGGPAASVRYFIEGQYVTPHDTQWLNDQNNASYIEVSVANNGSRSMSRISQTFQALTAVQGWSMMDPTVQLDTVMVSGDGRFDLASKVTDLGDGQWRYVYTLHNYNSDRSGGSFTVPLGECVEVDMGSIEFHDVDYHSGEPYNGNDWAATVSSDSISWNTDQTFGENPNANALRWGTSYSFAFVANSGPQDDDATIGLFKTGTSATINTQSPGPTKCPLPPCPGDVAPVPGDSQITIADVTAVLSAFGPCVGCPEDFVPEGGDGQVSIADVNAVLAAFGTVCE